MCLRFDVVRKVNDFFLRSPKDGAIETDVPVLTVPEIILVVSALTVNVKVRIGRGPYFGWGIEKR